MVLFPQSIGTAALKEQGIEWAEEVGHGVVRVTTKASPQRSTKSPEPIRLAMDKSVGVGAGHLDCLGSAERRPRWHDAPRMPHRAGRQVGSRQPARRPCSGLDQGDGERATSGRPLARSPR